MENKEALRYNEGKNRLDLVPPILQEEVGKVMTFGAQKYEPYNWAKGMKWSKCIASAKRHLAAVERGEDFDPESGLLHLAHLGCNIAFLLYYMKHHPELDDRQHSYLIPKKIGLDIDGVLADFVGGWNTTWGTCDDPDCWKYDWNMAERFEILKERGELEQFYLSLPRNIEPSEVPFEPSCYVTSRPVDSSVTAKWLEINGFPRAKVYTVPMEESKVEIIKSTGIDIFVDDRFDNFVELNKAGICTFLFDTKANRRYNVGYKRIKDLKELV